MAFKIRTEPGQNAKQAGRNQFYRIKAIRKFWRHDSNCA